MHVGNKLCQITRGKVKVKQMVWEKKKSILFLQPNESWHYIICVFIEVKGTQVNIYMRVYLSGW